MYRLLLFVLCASAALAAPNTDRDTKAVATECIAASCNLPNCACSSPLPPIDTSTDTIPQFVVLTFDDSVTAALYSQYYETDLLPRYNADGCKISATFFVPHEYSDYRSVNSLYQAGFEIASNSITKNALSAYWLNATTDLEAEFEGSRQIISTFANIPYEHITGARTPLLQINGNKTYEAYAASGFLYDNSRPTRSGNPLFPYTMDFASTQECVISPCPDESIPGLWLLPVQMWIDSTGAQCSTLLACVIDDYDDDEDEVYSWLIQNFQRSYNGRRTPFTVLMNSAWFLYSDVRYPAYVRFLDYLTSRPDVFLVSARQVIQWAQNPVPLSQYTSCQTAPTATTCNQVNCALTKECTDIRYMGSCVPCPSAYPWLHNPAGDDLCG